MLLFATAAALTTQASAQDGAPPSNEAEVESSEEIVITATRRATALQDTALAVDAVSGDTIAENQAFSFESFARLNPSIQVNNRGVGDNQIIVRGISSAGKPTVGLYYDETIITGLGLDGGSDNQPNIQLHDVERVEILKGPQGTLFGASSLSGTVRVIANKPNLDRMRGGFSLAASDIRGGNAFYQAETYVDVPIVNDKVGIRAVAWADTGAGYIDRTGPFREQNVNDQQVYGGRAILVAKPADPLMLTFTALHQESSADGSQYFERDLGAYNSSSPTSETFEDNIDLYSFVGDFDAGFGSFTATTNYFNREMLARRDSTPTARRFGIPGYLGYNEGQELSNWTSELRFASALPGPFQFVVGGFYSQQDSDTATAAILADPATGVSPCDFAYDCREAGFATRDINSAYGTTEIEQHAFFAEGNYEITPNLTATAGVRYYKADISQLTRSTQSLRFPTSPVQTVDRITLDVETQEDKVSYNFALAYEATPDTTFYARAASGFRPGGANNAEAAQQQGITVPEQYTSDNLWNYEAGVKSWFANRMLYTELALFYIDWSDQQISVTDQGGTFVYIANAGKSVVKGAELTLNANPTDALSLSFGATYTDASLADDLPPTAETPAFDGDRIPYTPRWSAAGQFTYEQPVSADVSAYISGNANYRGSSYTGFNDLDGNYAKLDDYVLVNGRIGVRRGPLDLALFVDNIGDSAPAIGLRVTGDGYRVYTARPRTVGLRLTSNF